MNYALGCAFNLTDLFKLINLKKLKISCKECQAIIGTLDRTMLAVKIFKECYKLVIEDIIKNNVTFHFSGVGSGTCCMHMSRVLGKDFLNLRRAGKWKDVDILLSNFTGYEIRLYMAGRRTPREKIVYVDSVHKAVITRYTNNGKAYGDSKYDTYAKDYMKQILDKFPEVPKSDITKILKYGWKWLYLLNSYGGDVLIKDLHFLSYIGVLRGSALKHFLYYKKKLAIKIRFFYKAKRIPWNGYYYFALTEPQYQSYLSQQHRRGRPRKRFNFGTVKLYQIEEECRLVESYKKYIFKVPMIAYLGSTLFRYEFVTKGAELIDIRSPLKFKDILVNNNKYENL